MKIHAYIDESGDINFNEGASETLVYSCVIVNAEDVEKVKQEALSIRERFKLPEFKSAKIGSESRRLEILQALSQLPIKHASLVIDKANVHGVAKNYKKSFYKYLQRLLHEELFMCFQQATVSLDKYGDESYQASMKEYMDNKFQTDLFERVIEIDTAKENVLIQLADFLGGTLRKLRLHEFAFESAFDAGLNGIRLFEKVWPTNRQSFAIEGLSSGSEQDNLIRKICIERAESFETSRQSTSHYQEKLEVVNYLLFIAKYIDPQRSTKTDALISWLKPFGYDVTKEEFRNQIIAGLRDEGVIISGTRSGLKIPTQMIDIERYLNHGLSIAIPVVRRANAALDSLKNSSMGAIDLSEDSRLKMLRALAGVIASHDTVVVENVGEEET